jgi:hypothetical protein
MGSVRNGRAMMMKIIVRCAHGTEEAVTVSSTDTVGHLKDKLRASGLLSKSGKSKVPRANMLLLCGNHPLQWDTSKLEYYHVTDGCILNIFNVQEIHGGTPIFLKLPGEEIVPVQVNRDSQVEALHELASEMCLLRMLRTRANILDLQSLQLCFRGRTLPLDRTLRQCRIEMGNVIQCERDGDSIEEESPMSGRILQAPPAKPKQPRQPNHSRPASSHRVAPPSGHRGAPKKCFNAEI